MESIIQQICSELIEKILKTLKESDNLHISSIMPVVLEDCKAASLEITKEYIKDVNIERSEEHTTELQSRQYLVSRLLLENKQSHSKFPPLLSRYDFIFLLSPFSPFRFP